MAGVKSKFPLVLIVCLGLFFAAFLLFFEQPSDNLPDNPSFTAVSKIKGKDNEHFELVLLEILEDRIPAPPPSLLWFDYKQNLLLWPVVAGEITRSPPIASGAPS